MKRIGPIFFILIGLGCAGFSLWLTVRTTSFISSAKATGGTVVELESHRSGGRRRGTTYRPVFEFVDAQGVKHRITERTGSNPAAFDRGETVTVLYNPEHPDEAHIKAFTTLWLGPTITGGIAFVFLPIGVLTLLKRR
jgi:hypothetical protein